MPRRNERAFARGLAALFAIAALPSAHALSTDRNQPMDVRSQYAKTTEGTDNAPGIAYLRGDVRIVQGSMKANSAEATVYQHPSNAKDAQGNDVSGTVKRVVLVGKGAKAHMQQQQDGGGLVTADADNIDYDNDTSIAVLTGGVTVVQEGRGTFNGEHMTYNTNTGEMESTDAKNNQPVHMVFEPKNKPATPAAAAPAADAAAKPAETAKPAGRKSKKTQKPAAAPKPAAGDAAASGDKPASGGTTP